MKNNKGIIFAIWVTVVFAGVIIVFLGIKFYKEHSNNSYCYIAVEKADGDILVTRNSGNEFNAYEGMRIKDGDTVSVLEAGELELCADDDKYLIAKENTRFSLETNDNGNKIIIYLSEGKVLVDIEDELEDDEAYEVHTLNSVMVVRGTTFSIKTGRDKSGVLETELFVFDGTVESACVVDGEIAEKVTVKVGQKLIIKGENDSVELSVELITREDIRLDKEEPESTEAPTEAPEPESTEIPTEAPEPESTEIPTEASEPESTEIPTEALEPESTEVPTEATELESTEPDETAKRATIEEQLIGIYEGQSDEGIPIWAEISRDSGGYLVLYVSVAGMVRTVSALEVEMSLDEYGMSCTRELMPGTRENLRISFDENILESGISSAQVEYTISGFFTMSYSATVTKK